MYTYIRIFICYTYFGWAGWMESITYRLQLAVVPHATILSKIYVGDIYLPAAVF